MLSRFLPPHAEIREVLDCGSLLPPSSIGRGDERQNRTVNRTLGKVPLEIWEAQSQGEEGRNYEITPTLRRTATLVHPPRLRFWVLELPPKDVWTPILGHFTL